MDEVALLRPKLARLKLSGMLDRLVPGREDRHRGQELLLYPM